MEQQDLFADQEDRSLLKAFGWWEKRRIYYNLIVGACGVFTLFSISRTLSIIDVIGIILYGLIANLFYSLGFLIEIAAKYYFKSEKKFTNTRLVFFIIGLLISILITLSPIGDPS